MLAVLTIRHCVLTSQLLVVTITWRIKLRRELRLSWCLIFCDTNKKMIELEYMLWQWKPQALLLYKIAYTRNCAPHSYQQRYIKVKMNYTVLRKGIILMFIGFTFVLTMHRIGWEFWEWCEWPAQLVWH